MRGFRSFGVVTLLVALLAVASWGQGAGTWTRGAPLLSSRTEVTGAELGGRLYVIGGFGQGGDQVEAYDPRADRWERRAPVPVPLHHAAAVTVGGRLYVVGGYAGGQWAALDTVFEYDPGADRWRARAPLPTARGRARRRGHRRPHLRRRGRERRSTQHGCARGLRSRARIAGSRGRRCRCLATTTRRRRSAGSSTSSAGAWTGATRATSTPITSTTRRPTAGPPGLPSRPRAAGSPPRCSDRASSCSAGGADGDLRPGRGLRRRRGPMECPRADADAAPRPDGHRVRGAHPRPVGRPPARRLVQRRPRGLQPLTAR